MFSIYIFVCWPLFPTIWSSLFMRSGLRSHNAHSSRKKKAIIKYLLCKQLSSGVHHCNMDLQLGVLYAPASCILPTIFYILRDLYAKFYAFRRSNAMHIETLCVLYSQLHHHHALYGNSVQAVCGPCASTTHLSIYEYTRTLCCILWTREEAAFSSVYHINF